MQSSGYKKFCEGIQYKSIPFDFTISTITKLIPLSQPYYLIIDSLFNLHLAKNPVLPTPNQTKYPIPNYASTQNPKVVYSIDPERIYQAAYGRVMEFDVREAFLDFLNFDHEDVNLQHNVVKVNGNSVVVQFHRREPPFILDFRYPNKPMVLNDIKGAKFICPAGEDCFFYIRKGLNEIDYVFCYNITLRKSKKLNFKCHKGDIKLKVHHVKEHVIILESKISIQFLNSKTNKLIKTVPIFDAYNAQVNYETSLVMYNLKSELLHLFEFKDGELCNENKVLLFGVTDELTSTPPILLNRRRVLIVKKNTFLIYRAIRLNLQLEDDTNSLIDPRMLEELDSLCCLMAVKDRSKSYTFKLFLVEKEDFYLVTNYCESDKTHGLQKISFGQLKQKKSQKKAIEIKFNEILSEYQDPVVSLSLSIDKKSAVFITERARLFEIDLISHKVKLLAVLEPLLSYLIESKSKLKPILDIYHLKTPGHYAITVPFHENCIWAFFYSQDDFRFKHASKFVFFDVLSLAYNQGTLIALTEQEFSGDIFYDLVPLDEKGYGHGESRPEFYNSSPDKIWNIFPDLYLVSDSKHSEIFLYDGNVKLIGRKKYDKLFDDEYIEDLEILDVKPISEKLYMLIADAEDGINMTIMNNLDVVCRYNELGSLKFVFRINDEMIFFKKMQYGTIFRAKTSEILQIREENLEANKSEEIDVEEFDYEEDIDRYRLEEKTFKYLQPFKSCVGYERFQNRNAICVYREYNVRIEMLNLMKNVLGEHYHLYILKDVYNFLNIKRFNCSD